jgi:hypothetical protein
VTEHKRGGPWSELCAAVESFPEGQLWRHNVSGDLPGVGNRVNRRELRELVAANTGRRGFTYTHVPPTDANLAAVREANAGGFTINLSAHGPEHVDRLRALAGPGVPLVTIQRADAPRREVTPDGHVIRTCPAAISDRVTCATCGVCAQADRDTVIGFPVHGGGAKAAEATL